MRWFVTALVFVAACSSSAPVRGDNSFTVRVNGFAMCQSHRAIDGPHNGHWDFMLRVQCSDGKTIKLVGEKTITAPDKDIWITTDKPHGDSGVEFPVLRGEFSLGDTTNRAVVWSKAGAPSDDDSEP